MKRRGFPQRSTDSNVHIVFFETKQMSSYLNAKTSLHSLCCAQNLRILHIRFSYQLITPFLIKYIVKFFLESNFWTLLLFSI